MACAINEANKTALGGHTYTPVIAWPFILALMLLQLSGARNFFVAIGRELQLYN
jgi:hypothetical protein